MYTIKVYTKYTGSILSVQSVNIFYKRVQYTLSTMNLEPLKYTGSVLHKEVYFKYNTPE